MRYSGFVIAILIVGAIFMGMYSFASSLAEVSDDYTNEINMTYANTYNNMNKVGNTSSEMITTIKGGDDKGWVVDKLAYLALIPQALSLLKEIMFLPIDFFDDMITQMLPDLGIAGDSLITTFLISIITLSIIFAFIALILKYRYI